MQLLIPQQTLVKSYFNLIWSLGRVLQGEETLSQCLPESGNLSTSVWSRAGREDGLHKHCGQQCFPYCLTGISQCPEPSQQGDPQPSPAVSAPNYWPLSMRKLNSIWVPREPVGEQAFGEFPFLPQVGISPGKSWTTLPESLCFPSCTVPTHWRQNLIKTGKRGIPQLQPDRGKSAS